MCTRVSGKTQIERKDAQTAAPGDGVWVDVEPREAHALLGCQTVGVSLVDAEVLEPLDLRLGERAVLDQAAIQCLRVFFCLDFQSQITTG